MTTRVSDIISVAQITFELLEYVLTDGQRLKVNQKGSRLAHLYGLPKIDKNKLAMQTTLSAVGT